MSTSGDISSNNSSTTEYGEIGGGNDDEKKMSTSYEQKSKISGGEGEGNSSDIDIGSSGKSASDIDVISEKLSDNTIGSMTISDNELFKDPPPKEDCSICMQPMPHFSGMCGVETAYMPCCGKTICSGCMHAAREEMKKGAMKPLCLYCRVPLKCSVKELMKRYKKRMKLNDPEAFFTLAIKYKNGEWGLSRDFDKALELFNRAAEIGSPRAHSTIAQAQGQGVKRDMVKTMHHYELAAIGGHERARITLARLNIMQAT